MECKDRQKGFREEKEIKDRKKDNGKKVTKTARKREKSLEL